MRTLWLPLALAAGLLLGCDDAPATGLDGGSGAADDSGASPGPDGGGALALDSGPPPDSGTTTARDAGPPPPEPGHVPGARLRPQWATSEDGSQRRFLQVWDTQLDTACWLTRFATDTTTVSCIPRPSGTIVYLDAACTQRRVESLHATGWVNAGDVVRLGARVAPPALRYMEIGPGQCVRQGTPPDATIYEIAELAGPGTLATGRVVDDPPQEQRLLSRTFHGADGSRFLYDVVDRIAAASCTPALTEAGARCRPDMGELSDEGLLDVTCQRLAILDYVRTAVAPIAARNGDVYRFEHPGLFGQQEFGRLDAGGRCVREERNVGRYTVHLGTPYPPRDWPPITIDSSGDDALRAHVGRLVTGERAEPEPRVDPLRLFETGGEVCGLARDGAGGLRCVPPPAEGVRDWMPVFADNRCSQPALAMTRGVAPPARVTFLDRRDPTQLAPLATVFAVGERLEARRVFTGSCEPVETSGLPPGDYYRLGPSLPLDGFPRLRVTTTSP